MRVPRPPAYSVGGTGTSEAAEVSVAFGSMGGGGGGGGGAGVGNAPVSHTTAVDVTDRTAHGTPTGASTSV